MYCTVIFDRGQHINGFVKKYEKLNLTDLSPTSGILTFYGKAMKVVVHHNTVDSNGKLNYITQQILLWSSHKSSAQVRRFKDYLFIDRFIHDKITED